MSSSGHKKGRRSIRIKKSNLFAWTGGTSVHKISHVPRNTRRSGDSTLSGPTGSISPSLPQCSGLSAATGLHCGAGKFTTSVTNLSMTCIFLNFPGVSHSLRCPLRIQNQQYRRCPQLVLLDWDSCRNFRL